VSHHGEIPARKMSVLTFNVKQPFSGPLNDTKLYETT